MELSQEEIYSKVLRAGRRTDFRSILGEMMDFIIKERGDEVISERHQKDYKSENRSYATSQGSENFTDLSFEDI